MKMKQLNYDSTTVVRVKRKINSDFPNVFCFGSVQIILKGYLSIII